MILENGLRRSARLWPEKIALIDDSIRLTYAQFAVRVNRLANALVACGLHQGDRVAVLMVNSFRYTELYYAINVAGGVIVPLNTRLALPELQFIVDDSASTMLVITKEFVEAARHLHQHCSSLSTLIFAEDEPLPVGFSAYEELVKGASPLHPQREAVETDLACIFYTGGTTGIPKGVMLSQRNLVDNAYRTIMHGIFRRGDMHLHAAAMFHIGGTSLFSITYLGGTHVHIRQFEPRMVLKAIEQEHITVTLLVPTMITALISHPDVHMHDLSSLQRITYGASPIAPDILRTAMRVLSCQFIQAYGMTEATSIVTLLAEIDHRPDGPDAVQRRLGSAGQVAMGIELRIVDENEHDVPTDTAGELILRGANIMVGYWKRSEETAKAMSTGWYHTGDIAVMDEAGYIYIIDRKKDMIISGGENVYSVEVENVLYSHPSVLEVAVIGIPDERWGEVVTAVVACRPEDMITPEELIAYCRTRIASYKVPKCIYFMERLPKSGPGKILKRELREMYKTR